MLRTPYNYDRLQASIASGLSCPEPTLTQQHYKEQASIQNIVDKYTRTGQVEINTTPPLPSDFVKITDYQTAMNLIKRGEKAFYELPSKIRNEFEHDVGQFINALNDPTQLQRFQKLGVFKTPENPPAVNEQPVAQ